jgi:DNA-binding NarL/FixJ family response regulator
VRAICAPESSHLDEFWELWTDQLNRTSVLLADDHPHFPDLIQRLLGPEFEVVGKVNDGRKLIAQALRLNPDLIVTDISMPMLNGIEAADRLNESDCRSRVIFLSVHTDADVIRRCLATGAYGYVVKTRLATELMPAIREALAGRIFVSRELPPETRN